MTRRGRRGGGDAATGVLDGSAGVRVHVPTGPSGPLRQSAAPAGTLSVTSSYSCAAGTSAGA